MTSEGAGRPRAAPLAGKVAMVTGGSRGIGRAIALAMAAAGADIAVTYLDDDDAAESTVADIAAMGGRAQAWAADVRDREAVRASLAEAREAFGTPTILVNNAGINKPTDFADVTDDDWREIMEVNLRGPFVVTQEAMPGMATAGGGSIVMIGSVSGQYGGPRTAHYAASKAGLISLAQVIARTGAADGIRCNTVAAGLIQSDMAEAGMANAAVQKAADTIPLRRMGTPDEVAAAAVWLASDASGYVTAQTINVNGGLYF